MPEHRKPIDRLTDKCISVINNIFAAVEEEVEQNEDSADSINLLATIEVGRGELRGLLDLLKHKGVITEEEEMQSMHDGL